MLRCRCGVDLLPDILRGKCEPLSLRFHNKATEGAFVSKRVASVRWLMIALAFWIFWITVIRQPLISVDTSLDSVEVGNVFRGVMIPVSVSMLVVPIVASDKWPVFTETFVIGMFVITLVGQAVSRNDTFNFVRMLAGIHLVVKLRWSSLVVLSLVSLTAFNVISVFTDTLTPTTIDQFVFVNLHAVLFSWVTRSHEIEARMLFLILLEERTKRVEREHELSMKSDPTEKMPDDTRSQQKSVKSHGCVSSIPETTETGKLFDIAGDPGTTVDRLMDIGQQENWLIKERELSLKPHVVGQGGFGIVFSGEFCGMPVAVKMTKKQDANMGSLLRELRSLRKVRHPNIICFHGCCFLAGKPSILLVTEFSSGQRMTAVVNGDVVGHINDLHRCEMLNGLLNALHYLHTRSPIIVHGDLKPGNCLVDVKARFGSLESPDCRWELQVRLLDFGLSLFCTSKAVGGGGTLRWIAPELILNSKMPPSSSTDVFSMGRLIYYVVTGLLPFHNYSCGDIAANCVDMKMDWPYRSKMEAALHEYADLCMNTSPGKRPTIPATHRMTTVLLQGLKKKFLGASDASPHENVWEGLPLQDLVDDIQRSIAAGATKKGSLSSDDMAPSAACSSQQWSEPRWSGEQVPTNDFVEITVHSCDPTQNPQVAAENVLAKVTEQDANHPAVCTAL